MKETARAARRIVIAAAAVVIGVVGSVVPAHGAGLDQALMVTLIGDSYSAGNGAGDYYGPDGSYRSINNWASRYVDWLKSSGVHATLDNLAHSGYTTSQIQDVLDQVSSSSDLVMFTAGGNDVKFSEIVTECFVTGLRDPWSCQSKIDAARAGLGGIESGTTKILEGLEGRLSNKAQVVLVGYPLLSLDNDYSLFECRGSTFGIATDCKSYAAGDEVRKLGSEASALQQKIVDNWNAKHALKVTYVRVQDAFGGHEPDDHATNKNDFRWVNEFLETRGRRGSDGKTTSEWSWDSNEWYHPNLIGHDEIAALLESKIGVPSNTRTIVPAGEAIDIAFVIDTTGSMSDDIDAVRNNVKSIIDQVSAQTSGARFALVSYRDDSRSTGDSIDYASRLDLGFTTDGAALKASLDTLEANGGGDTPETVYSGVMKATELAWRSGVRKIAVVLGDAPPKDPEPFTGYTASSVASAAYAIDPVEVYGVDTGSLASTEFQALVTASGGRIFDASTAGAIPAALIEAAKTSLAKPFAWLQGPYVAKVGATLTLDARGSYGIGVDLVRYEWDFDGDGTYDASSATPTIEHSFGKEITGVVGVRVTDVNGLTGTGTTHLGITDDGDEVPRAEDNCPDVANHGQSDYDLDGMGDACDSTPGYPAEDKPGVFEQAPVTPTPTPSETPPPGPGPSGTPHPVHGPRVETDR